MTAYFEARAAALARCLDADPAVLIVGYETSAPFNPDDGLRSRYPDRFLTPPISEFAVLSASVGAACAGLRPFVSVGTSTFAYYGWSALVNEAPHIRYLSGGEVSAPVVVHFAAGARRAGGVQHDHTPQAMLQNVPGLTVHTPATPQSVYDAIVSALTGGDPVVIADHVLLGETEGPLDERHPAERPGAERPGAERPGAERPGAERSGSTEGRAEGGGPWRCPPVEVLREGGGGLIVGSSLMSVRAREAAEAHGLDVTVANVTTLSPSPRPEIAALAAQHPFTLFVDEARATGSPAASLLASTAEQLPNARLHLLAAGETFYPFDPGLLDEVVPTAERIAEAATRAAQPR